ncbi:MAG: sodium:proton antiporter NhaD, partial [Chromatiales bacterium]|nr:sodium:proton antiporter NhaD [Chromatiales bacterium]
RKGFFLSQPLYHVFRQRFIIVFQIHFDFIGTFSPFGDITTLMVWQQGVLEFGDFFRLALPALVNWLVPALIMSFTVPRSKPAATDDAHLKYGAFTVFALFAFTIAMTVVMHHYLHLPPVIGMMTGLGLLKVYGYYLRRRELTARSIEGPENAALEIAGSSPHKPFDIFKSLKRSEWDTLMFFYGVILCVGGLGTIGYLALLSDTMYSSLGATTSNVLIGVLSAIIDNIPVMFAVLTMHPDMSSGQWLLVTMTAGVGGSLLSIGSAAGVALMGQAPGIYTFFTHLRWAWAIALGYAASIVCHLWVNAALM